MAFQKNRINIMKAFIAIFSLILLFTGCGKENSLTDFKMDFTSSVTIPSSSTIGLPFSLDTPPVESNSESEFESNDTRKDLITSIKLEELTLTITSPSSGNFDFLKSITIYIEAEGLTEKLVATKTDIQDGVGKFVSLTVQGQELQEFIKKDNFSLRLSTETDKTINQDHKIDIYSKFKVNANLIGS